MTPAEAAAHYLRRGWSPVPLREKRPFAVGWPSRLFAEADFSDADGVGLHLLDGLCDVDLDSPEALVLAPRLLPPTPLRFGRASSRASHWLYLSDAEMTRYQVEGDCLVELRTGRGKQTMAPPSRHPSGEYVRWEPRTPLGAWPARVDGSALVLAVARIAAGVVLMRQGWDIPRTLASVASPVVVEGVPEVAARWLGWVAAPRPVRRVAVAVSPTYAEAVRQYNREHSREFPSRRVRCPMCGGSGFAAARRGGWACFSSRHTGPGLEGRDCWTGDVLDIDAHAAGVGVAEWLRECGYLEDRLERFAPDVYDEWAGR